MSNSPTDKKSCSKCAELAHMHSRVKSRWSQPSECHRIQSNSTHDRRQKIQPNPIQPMNGHNPCPPLHCQIITVITRRPASADRTARRQFQVGQPVSRTHASDAMTSRLSRYEAKCVQRRCFQCRTVPLRSDIKGTELPLANILIPLERQLTMCR